MFLQVFQSVLASLSDTANHVSHVFKGSSGWCISLAQKSGIRYREVRMEYLRHEFRCVEGIDFESEAAGPPGLLGASKMERLAEYMEH